MNKLRLLSRLALAILIAGVFFGVVAAYSLYKVTLSNEFDDANMSIEQLFNTVSPTASIAAYFEDPELAKEVVNGLETNNTVDKAVFEAGKLIVGDITLTSQAVLSFDVNHPFMDDSIIGKLRIYPDLDQIRRSAEVIAYANALTLVAMALVMTFLAITICYLLITRPMVATGRALHHISPGTESRLSTPNSHQHSEIGQLVDDVNHLLSKAEDQLIQERELRNQIEKLEQRFRLLFENSIAPIILLTNTSDIVLKNKAYDDLLKKLNITSESKHGPLLSGLFVEQSEFFRKVNKQLELGEFATGEYRLATDGELLVWMQVVVTKIYSDDKKTFYQLTMHDITKRREQLEALSIEAHVDKLTGLYNRAATEKEIIQKIRYSIPFALVLIDLNGFKQVNDIYGHEAGDLVLKYVARAMQEVTRKNDIASRWGGDEFVYVLDDINKNAVIRVLQTFRAKLSTPIKLEHRAVEVTVGASMGVSFYPDTSTEIETLIRRADKAMYRAKALKKIEPENCIFFAEQEQ